MLTGSGALAGASWAALFWDQRVRRAVLLT